MLRRALPPRRWLSSHTGTGTFFQLFDLPQKHTINEEALKNAFRKKQSLLHPDKHVGKDVTEFRKLEAMSASVNEAYKTLVDPVLRAKYLLKLEGVDVSSEQAKDGDAGAIGDKVLSRMELLDMLEYMEELECLPDVASAQSAFGDVEKRISSRIEKFARLYDVDRDIEGCISAIALVPYLERAKVLVRHQLDELENKQRV